MRAGTRAQLRLGLPWARLRVVSWSDINPRQRRGILLLTLSALGLLGVFVLVAGYVADVRAEVDPKVEGPHPRQAGREGQVDHGRHGLHDGAAPRLGAEDRPARPRAADRPGRARRPPGRQRAAGGHDRLAARAGHRGVRDRDPRRRRDGGGGQDRPPARSSTSSRRSGGNDQEGIAPESNVVVPGARIIDVGQPELKGGNARAGPGRRSRNTVVPVTFALDPREALTVTYAESFAAEVRLALLRPGEESELKKKERVYRLLRASERDSEPAAPDCRSGPP